MRGRFLTVVRGSYEAGSDSDAGSELEVQIGLQGIHVCVYAYVLSIHVCI